MNMQMLSPTLSFSEFSLRLSLRERRILEHFSTSISVMGNRSMLKLIQLMLGKGFSREMMRQTEWNLREKAPYLPPIDDSSFSHYSIMMNIIIWNYREALKPSFQSDVRELITKYDSAILVIMETHISGDRAKEITNRLPFQGAIHTDTIGYARGMLLLWNVDEVEVSNLTSNEQEIHAIVKVNSSNLSWLFYAIYASRRYRERCLLWNNLSNVAQAHSLPWIIGGDFNEMLSSDDKFSGRPIIPTRALLFKECLDDYNMADLGFQGPRFIWTNKHDITSLIQDWIGFLPILLGV